jgi:uncharacterized phiE125 gp8 family phage protein
MVEGDPLVPGAAALAEARDYLRISGSAEDALLARALGSAADLCEQFTGEVLLARGFKERLAPSAAWTKLGRVPVRAITAVEALRDGSATALPASAFLVDIDAAGSGWVRVLDAGGAGRILVHYECGRAADWAGVPEALRHGTLRLAAHLYTHRSGAEDRGPPAAVTALWRPYRRLRIA